MHIMLGDDDAAPSISVTAIQPVRTRPPQSTLFPILKVADGALLPMTHLLILLGNRRPSSHSKFCMI
jgi:hypothetical protein